MYALKAVNPSRLVKEKIRFKDPLLIVEGTRYDLRNFDRIFVVGAGKASAPMAVALEDVLGDRITDGLVIVKYGHSLPLSRIRLLEAGHPFPDRKGLKATNHLIKLVSGLTRRDLVFCLISGGGSSLLCLPPEGITLTDLRHLTRLLLASGAGIKEINTLRKHLSMVHGGRLAGAVYPATLISLVLSDVVGDQLDMVASGPTVPDVTTFEDALSIISRYRLTRKLPPNIYRYIKEGADGHIPDNPRKEDPCFKNTQALLLGSNAMALEAAGKRACALGFNTLILSSSIIGESREVARVFTSMAKEVLRSGHPVPRPACLLAGGETTVNLMGRGKGGRNQEFALASALELDGWEGIVVLSGGTDGTDGPTEVAGAVVDGNTCKTAQRRYYLAAREYLDRNDSYSFFQKSGGHLATGPTLTNVMDVMMALVG